MYMAKCDSKLYVLLRAPFAGQEQSGLVCYDLADGLTPVNPGPILPTGGRVACHLYVRGGQVYAANYTSGSVSLIGHKTVQHTGSGPHPTRQASPHTHFVTATPDEKYLCVTDLGLDKLVLYDFALNMLGSVPLPAGSGPRHLTFSGDGRRCYVANELASTVSCFDYADGSFTLLDTISCLPQGFAGESACGAIRWHDGKLFVSNRGHDSLAVIQDQGGRLSLCGVYSVCGKTPRDFIVSDDTILVTNQDSNEAVLFDSRMNRLAATEEIPAPLCALWL